MTGQIIATKSCVRHDFIGKITNGTSLLRKTVYQILLNLRPEVFGNYRRNPEEFIRRAIRMIEDVKAPMISENIHYYVTGYQRSF